MSSSALRLSRRAALASAALAPAGLASAGCALPPPPATWRPESLPRDKAAVFHGLLAGQPAGPLDAPEFPWQSFADSPAAIALTPEGLRLVSVPSARVWASPLLPVTPLNAIAPGQIEELTWEASITLERRYFVVCEVRFAGEPGALLFQATPFDIQVMQDRARPGGGTSQSISRLAGDGRPHLWRLRLDGARTELRLDGSAVWSLEGRRALARVAFGETRTDGEHGGSMLLRDVVYVRRPA